MSIFAELRRRNVFRVGIAYAIVAWLVLQVADVVLNNITAPDWVFQAIMLVLGIGFPVVLIFAWAFELTPEGVKREKDVDRSQSITPQTGHKLDRMIIAVLLLGLGYFALDKFILEPRHDRAAIRQTEVVQADRNLPEEPAGERPSAASSTDLRKSIVVLPFVNMSADPDQEYFSDGLSEELLNVLAKIDDLRVISRTSAFAFKGKEISLPEIARQLDVSYVLEGSVRSAGDQVRITAQLIEVDSDSHLWSDAYNRKLENVFEIQEEISQAIARELQVELGAGPVAGKPTENLEAYQLFLRGRHHYQARREENMQLAVDSLTQAVELDPGFADAWANLAAASAVLSFYLAEDFVPARQEAERAARRAIELDAGNGFARAVLGLLLSAQLDFEAAVHELERAIELNPSESNSYLWMGITLSELGYIDRAIDYLERAERFDPVFVNLQNWLSALHATAGNTDKHLLHRERRSRLSPGFGANLPGAIEFMRGDVDGAYAAYVRNAEASGEDLIAADYMFAALRDPGKRAESAGLLLKHASRNDLWGGVFYELWQIGAVEEAIAHWWDLREAGRTLRAASSLSNLWVPWLHRNLSHPATLKLFRETGLADYWRAHGDPDYCRVLPDNRIECEST